jgi:hypothetical protein
MSMSERTKTNHLLTTNESDDATLPRVEAELRTLRPEPGIAYRVWEVHCPYCGRKHRHGAGWLDEDPRQHLGSRASHCDARHRASGEVYVLVARPGQLPGERAKTRGSARARPTRK